MNKILLMHGPNLNLLGKRDVSIYGNCTLSDIENMIIEMSKKLKFSVTTYQSNHEGELIDYLQHNAEAIQGIIINPGALTHYSFALLDALQDTRLPIVEVHLSDIHKREAWRAISVTSAAAIKMISGKKEKGYIEALHFLVEYIKNGHHE